eukprot:5105878-Prymnesium_polylepis.1
MMTHHIVMDGPSQSIVYGHLQQLLAAERSPSSSAPAQLHECGEADMARHALANHFAALETPPIDVPAHVCNMALPFARARPSKPASGSFQHIISTETVAALRGVALANGLTLNALVLGTLASFLHRRCRQPRFAIAQSYLGRQLDQMGTVGSFSSSAPLVFSFEDDPPLRSTCRHVLEETQRMMAVKVIGDSPAVDVRYELNDLRPMKIPTANGVQGQGVPGFFVVAVEYADGLLLLV